MEAMPATVRAVPVDRSRTTDDGARIGAFGDRESADADEEGAMPTPSVVLATAGYDHTIRFWEATRGVCYRTLQYADSQVNELEITPDKRYLAAGGNPHVRLFEVNASNPQPVTSYDGHTGNVTAVGFEPQGSWMYEERGRDGEDLGFARGWVSEGVRE